MPAPLPPEAVGDVNDVLSIARRWKTGDVPPRDVVIFGFRIDHSFLEVRNLPDPIALDHRK